MPSLEVLQSCFAEAFDRTPAAAARLLPLLKGPKPLAARRFALYLNNSEQAWHRALAHAYPVLKTLVGDECFRALARDYSQFYSSQSGDLNEFGVYFADFIRHLELISQYPYFADMVRLEWQIHRAYYAAHDASLSVEDWTALTPEEVAHAQIEFHPAFSLFTSNWAVIDIWRAHQLDNPIWPARIESPNVGMIVRPAWRVEVLSLAPDAFEALESLYQGHTVEEAITRALGVNPHFDFLSNVRRWLEFAILTRILPR